MNNFVDEHTTQNNKLGAHISLAFIKVATYKHNAKQTNNVNLEKNALLVMVNDQSY
jgi:hypothetical protein